MNRYEKVVEELRFHLHAVQDKFIVFIFSHFHIFKNVFVKLGQSD